VFAEGPIGRLLFASFDQFGEKLVDGATIQPSTIDLTSSDAFTIYGIFPLVFVARGGATHPWFMHLPKSDAPRLSYIMFMRSSDVFVLLGKKALVDDRWIR
jgi:hypothetical protein